MTMLAFAPTTRRPHTTATAPITVTPAGRKLSRLLQTVRRRAAAPAATPTARATLAAEATEAGRRPGPAARGCLRLTLDDGISRLYLLDARDFATTTSPEVAYDARVHTAYLLTLQGHRPEWLGRHLDLPTVATSRIAEHAERSGPEGPGTMPPRT